MPKMRVHEVAKLYNKSSKEVIAALKQQGVEVQSHMSTVTEENVSKLRQYEDRSDEFKFVLAIEDNKYQTIVDLKDKVFVDEERESVIVNAYIELEQMEEALIYAKSTDNESLISTVEEILDSKNDKEKENDDEWR